MPRTQTRGVAALAAGLVAALLFATRGLAGSTPTITTLPDPAVDQPVATARGEQTIVLAGGCFWGVQAVFQHVKGVLSATSGYAGGTLPSPSYEQVSSSNTGHAESVKIVFDSSQVSLGQLLKVFFSVAHDPTELNRQGPDVGTQYRSAVFYTNDEQRAATVQYIAWLQQSGTIRGKIVTEVAPLSGFYVAAPYHQDYATLHPNEPYIRYNDLPKVARLKERYPQLWSEERASY